MKRKKIINIIIILFIGTFLFCLYFSKTIKNMLLPKVVTMQLSSGVIGDNAQMKGVVKYENTNKIYAEKDWKIKEISVKVNQSIKKGDILGKVDNEDINLREREQNIEIMKLQEELKEAQNEKEKNQDKIKQIEYQIATEKIKYKEIRKGLDEDGNIISDMDGTIVNAGLQDSESSALFEIADNNTKFSVSFEIDSKDVDKFLVGDTVSIFLETDSNDNKGEQFNAVISQKIYNSEKESYTLLAQLDNPSNIKVGDTVSVSTTKEMKRYDNVIPKSCLTFENGMDYVYVINNKEGVLGDGFVAEKVQVQVVASDSTNCAVEAPNGANIPDNYGIIVSTSKEISNNCEVKLSTEN